MEKSFCNYIIAVIAFFTCSMAFGQTQTVVPDFTVGELSYKILEDNKLGITGFAEDVTTQPRRLEIPTKVTYN
ncbi:MAG: hypothetical protein K2K52_01115, partial [Paramuribaculum sp.]|nr:hypothetical protein [Paramuribaculum sp.]